MQSLLTLAVTILTGVMDQLPQGSCNPNITTYQQGAGQKYSEIPGSCKIAYGMATFVLIASIISMFGIAFRGDSFGFMKQKSAEAENKADPPMNPHGYQSTAIKSFFAQF